MSPLTTVWEAEAGRYVRTFSTLVLEALGRKLRAIGFPNSDK